MASLCKAVQGVVQGSVQGKHRAVIGLCKWCKGFSHAPARVNAFFLTHSHTTPSRAYRGIYPCTACTRLISCAFCLAQTLAQTLAHLAQMKKEKTINEFVQEMKAAGFDFEFKATRESDGMVVVSPGWREPKPCRYGFEAKPSFGYVAKADMEGEKNDKQ